MKANFKHILAALAVVAMTASCDRTADFKCSKFVTVDHTSYSVPEDGGEVIIPVHVLNATAEDVQVSVTSVDGTAKEGVDYELIAPTSGLLNFPAGTDSLAVKVSIKPQVGKYTGNMNFYIQVSSATEGVVNGNLTTAMVTIRDLDHPLAAFLGDWTGVYALANGQKLPNTISIVADPDDVTKVTIENLELYFAIAGGEVAPDANVFKASVNEDKTIITIPQKQEISPNYPGTVIRGFNAPSLQDATGYCDIELHLNPDGTLVMPNGFGALDSEGWWMYYSGGIVFTKN